jgi:hypothetical protein
MSTAARAALINVGTNRQGATPPPATPAAVLHELATLKLIGRGNGLTRRGTIKRELIVNELMDSM